MMHDKATILVVDRHATIQLLVQHHLEKNGYEVIVSESWGDTLTMLKTLDIQCVVGSYGREEYGCVALEKKFLKDKTTQIPFIYYSTLDKELVQLPNPDVDVYLQMPFSMEHFLKIIESSFHYSKIERAFA